MSRFRHVDIVHELIDLGHELRNEVRQQLLYYRASVYKQETAQQIHQKIDQLRLVINLFNDPCLMDIMTDYDAMVQNKQQSPVPGECSMSFRVTRLLDQVGQELGNVHREHLTAGGMVSETLTQNLLSHRRELMNICKHGSRPWNLLQNL